jgi:hypothetical protein
MTTQNTHQDNTLPAEFISHLTDVFSETFRAWAEANHLPEAITRGVGDALFMAESGRELHPQQSGEFVTSITQAIVIMGGKFRTGDLITISRPMWMLATDDTQKQAGRDSNLIDKFITEEVTA